MKTFFVLYSLIIYCICKITPAESYTRCTVPDTTRKAYGQTCTSSSLCLTEFCNSTMICTCPSDSFLDTPSGLCVKNGGLIFGTSGECGYLASSSTVSVGSVVSWSINGPPGTYITIVILDLDMDPRNCNINYFKIQEVLLYTTCGETNPIQKFQASKSNTLAVAYRKPAAVYRGFRAIYYIRSSSSELSEPIGYLVSPGFPLPYKIQLNNTWLISAMPGRVINATFLVDTESYSDHVYVYDGRNVYSSSLANLSGSVSLQTVRSSANHMLVQYTSDGSVGRVGFRATYEEYVLYGYPCSSFYKCLPSLVCTGNVCNCLSSQFYDTSTNTCRMKLSFGNLCPLYEECFEGLVCRDSLCVCSTSQYYDHDSRMCKGGVTFGKDCTNSTCVDGLYCYSGVCNCSSNQYYDQYFHICKVKITYGNICNSTENCATGLTCVGARCGCLTTHYYDQRSSTCSLKIAYGNICNSTENCATGLTCIGARCGCLTTHYYDQSTSTCSLTMRSGQLCDPSVENICELPNLVCAREIISTSNYTCQPKLNVNKNDTNETALQKDTGEDNSKTQFIAVAVVGWVAALLAIIAVLVLCLRNRKKSTKSNPRNHAVKMTNAARSDRNTSALQSTTRSNVSTPDVSQIQSTVNDLTRSNIKQNTSTKTDTSSDVPRNLVTPTFSQYNNAYQHDFYDKYDSIYEKINMDQILEDVHIEDDTKVEA